MPEAAPHVLRPAARRSLSILMPCMNEEPELALTFGEVIVAARQELDDFEIILLNDGSVDKTGIIMDELKAANPEVVVVHNETNQGLADAFRCAITMARCEHLIIIPGDHAFNINGITSIFRAVGVADFIASYRINQKSTRSWLRYFLTVVYNWIMLTVFLAPLKDVHSMNAYRVSLLRGITLISEGVAFQIETVIKLCRQELTILQLPVTLNPQKNAKNGLVRLRTVRALLRVMWHLLVDERSAKA